MVILRVEPSAMVPAVSASCAKYIASGNTSDNCPMVNLMLVIFSALHSLAAVSAVVSTELISENSCMSYTAQSYCEHCSYAEASSVLRREIATLEISIDASYKTAITANIKNMVTGLASGVTVAQITNKVM